MCAAGRRKPPLCRAVGDPWGDGGGDSPRSSTAESKGPGVRSAGPGGDGPARGTESPGRDGTGPVRPHRSAASRSARESQPDGAAKGVKVTAAPAEGEPSAAGLPLTRGTRGVCRGGWRSPGMNSPRPSGGAAAERRRLPGARERRAALLAVSAPAAALGRRAWGRDFPKACAARSRSQRGDRSLRATRGA